MTAENYCFCELAPLYSLDLLSEAEKRWVEQQLVETPELLEELANYQTAVAAIPYAVPAAPMAADLKARLFERLGVEPPTDSAVTDLPVDVEPPSTGISPYLTVRSQDLSWQPHPTPGVTIAIIHTDPAKREIVGLLRAEAGVCYPLHRHAAVEQLYMLEGDLIVDGQTYGAGDYIRSQPGSEHAPYTHGGCMFLFHTSMDDEYPDWAAAVSD